MLWHSDAKRDLPEAKDGKTSSVQKKLSAPRKPRLQEIKKILARNGAVTIEVGSNIPREPGGEKVKDVLGGAGTVAVEVGGAVTIANSDSHDSVCGVEPPTNSGGEHDFTVVAEKLLFDIECTDAD